MPYTSSRIKIAGTEHDRRRKLTEEQKLEIISLKDTGISQRKCAKEFGVSRRTIIFLWFPERLEENKQRRLERGGTKAYYDKESHRKSIAEHRAYKNKLYKSGVIGLPKEEE